VTTWVHNGGHWRPAVHELPACLLEITIGYQSMQIKYVTIPFVTVLFPGIVALLISAAVPLGEDITGMTYRSSAKLPAPLVHLDGSYSLMQDADPGWKIWFCGGDDRGDDPANYQHNFGDSIYYGVINTHSGGYYRSPEVILRIQTMIAMKMEDMLALQA
jgi:hypothetical protein